MKQSTKVTIIFVLIYFIWNFHLQDKLTKIAIDEDELGKTIGKLSDASDRLIGFLEKEKDQIEQLKKLLREVKTPDEKATEAKVPGMREKLWKEPIPVLVLACNRAASLRAHLEKLMKYRPSQEQFPIIVSLDCNHTNTEKEALSFGEQVQIIKHFPGASANIEVPPKMKKFRTYYYIARHYKLALNHVFHTKNFSSVIITEDDLDIAPDFFSFFSNTRYLLEEDRTLWCVSAWNDNGKPEHIDDTAATTLYRSDFVSGLGWMMNRETWNELEPKWPAGFWDDWMREPENRKGRQCIRPEISRTGMMEYGKRGASRGAFFKDHLRRIKVNDFSVNFSKTDLDYLLPGNFGEMMARDEADAVLMQLEEITDSSWIPTIGKRKVKIIYTGRNDFVRQAKLLGIMSDFKAGVPRTAYNGIVTCFFKNTRIFLVPDRSKVPNYDSSW